MPADHLVALMLRAQARGMRSSEYVFLYYSLTIGWDAFDLYPWLHGINQDDLTTTQLEYRKRAFYPLKRVSKATDTLSPGALLLTWINFNDSVDK